MKDFDVQLDGPMPYPDGRGSRWRATACEWPAEFCYGEDRDDAVFGLRQNLAHKFAGEVIVLRVRDDRA